jgi:hypothetical protein
VKAKRAEVSAALEIPRLWLDETRGAFWLDAIGQYHQKWDDDRGMFLEKPYHDWTVSWRR